MRGCVGDNTPTFGSAKKEASIYRGGFSLHASRVTAVVRLRQAERADVVARCCNMSTTHARSAHVPAGVPSVGGKDNRQPAQDDAAVVQHTELWQKALALLLVAVRVNWVHDKR